MNIKRELKIKTLIFLSLIFFNITALKSQSSDSISDFNNKLEKQESEKKWYDNISIRGYTQIRYNRLLESNEDLGCEQCDKSWGKGGGFFIRRLRVILSGQLGKHIYFYIQPDFASAPVSDKLNFTQIRDAYVDVNFDKKAEFRFRIGQSKVPYGFENLQSSQNRLALDRNDALNSAVTNERDIGVFFYWAPDKKRKLFSELVRSGLKGSGDYGVIGFGVFNGQTANALELNKQPHVIIRATYPFEIKKQIVEVGIQGYMGKYVLPVSNLSKGVKVREDLTYKDQRVAASFMLYPKPFGIQAEYNFGRGPEFNKNTDSIELQNLHGGYIQMMYNLKIKKHILIPFVKYQYYNGGKKHEKDARSYEVSDFEIGFEWQPLKYFEFVANYTFSNRRYEDFSKPNNFQSGRLLRLQAQLNF